MTWDECLDAGMTAQAAATLRGKSVAAARSYAKRHGRRWAPAENRKSEQMRARWADPEFRAKQAREYPNRRWPELARLTDAQRKLYRELKRSRLTREEALAIVDAQADKALDNIPAIC